MKYLRHCWYVAANADEASTTPFVRTILGEPIVIFRTESGNPAALSNRCPHRFAPMEEGKVRGEDIQCPYHGLRFDRTGKCTALPTGGPPPRRASLKAYPLVERHALLWIWMGDAARADAGLIPDCSRLQGADYAWWTGYLHADANYQLVTDNLLDLSHVEFIHPFLASDGWSSRNVQKTVQEGDQVTVTNIAENDPVIPMAKEMNPKLSPLGTMKQILRWLPASVLHLSIEYRSEGGNWIVPSGHFLTPETATSTHYFLRGGQGVDPGNGEMTAAMKAGTLHIFRTEDIHMIEQQQLHIGTADLLDLRPVFLKADEAAVRARRLLAEKIRLENDAARTVDHSPEEPRRDYDDALDHRILPTS